MILGSTSFNYPARRTSPPTLVLEYVPLKSLERQHAKRPLSGTEVVSILQHGLSALEYLQSLPRPIAHRDIKPASILVQSRNPFYIKLADFGLPKASESLHIACGIVKYWAPKVTSGRYTPAVDVWSLGVVMLLYVMVSLQSVNQLPV